MEINRRIIRRIIPRTSGNRPGYPMSPQYITIHNTANTNEGADAESHARYLENGAGGRSVSWHFTVDDRSIYQHLPTSESGWHAGDGNGAGNRKSIGIEICENADGDFDKAVKNAIELVQFLMMRFNIPIDKIVPHQKWTGKNCPRKLLDNWDDFILRIKGEKIVDSDEKVKTEIITKPKLNLLKRGDKGQAVKDFQMKLLQAGEKLPRFGADGVFGEETYYAVIAFQSRHGLVVDGIVGPKTRAKMEEVLKRKNDSKVIVPYPGHLIKRGSMGKDVKRIQRAVGVKVDGIFGPITEAAVKAYQRRHGLKVDGIVGPKTWNVMF